MNSTSLRSTKALTDPVGERVTLPGMRSDAVSWVADVRPTLMGVHAVEFADRRSGSVMSISTLLENEPDNVILIQ